MGRTYKICATISAVIAKSVFFFKAHGSDNIPREGGCLLAMNHESYLDPPLAGISAPRELFYLARKTLLNWPILGPLFPKLNVIPVNQERADRSALKTVIKQVKAGHCTVIFSRRFTHARWQAPARAAWRRLDYRQDALSRRPRPDLRGSPSLPARWQTAALPADPVGGRKPMEFPESDFQGAGRDLYQRLSDKVMARIAKIEPV